ncbi:MAG: flagellar hook capping FlgD N-terminal domain-containing protein [bacterium]
MEILNTLPANLANGVNQRTVRLPDPENPVIAGPEQTDSGQDFMRLMMEQLRHQDPLNPADGAQFTQQLATMNSLQALLDIKGLLENQSTGSGLDEATALLGYTVEGVDANGTLVEGHADSVEVLEGVPMLLVGDKLLLPGQVVSVREAQ